MKEKPQRVLFDVSWQALLKVVALALGLYVLVLLRDILVMLLVVFIFVAAANPTIARWQRRMSRTLAVTLFYVLMVAVLSLVSLLILPTLARQINDLVKAIPDIAARAQPALAALTTGHASYVDQAVQSLTSSLSQVSSRILETTYGVVGGLAFTVSALVLSFYLLLEEKNAREFFNQILPQHRFESVYETVSKISGRMGQWVRAQLLLMLIIGMANLVVYLLLGVPSPLPLAIWAGLCEVIPIVGPLLGVIPAVAVSLTTAGIFKAILVFLAGFVLIQQLEAHVVVPRVMGKAVGLSPVLVILALLIGVQLFGFVGAVLAVPTAAVISVIVGEWPALRRLWEEEPSA